MCLAIPGKIIDIDGKKATIEYPQETRDVLVGEDDIKVNDYVMVQMGIIVKKISAEEAQSAQAAWSS